MELSKNTMELLNEYGDFEAELILSEFKWMYMEASVGDAPNQTLQTKVFLSYRYERGSMFVQAEHHL